MAARKKVAAETEEKVVVGVTLIPYYAVTFDHPALSGTTAVGATPALALASARAAVARRFRNREIYPLNPETFARAGLSLSDWANDDLTKEEFV